MLVLFQQVFLYILTFHNILHTQCQQVCFYLIVCASKKLVANFPSDFLRMQLYVIELYLHLKHIWKIHSK